MNLDFLLKNKFAGTERLPRRSPGGGEKSKARKTLFVDSAIAVTADDKFLKLPPKFTRRSKI